MKTQCSNSKVSSYFFPAIFLFMFLVHFSNEARSATINITVNDNQFSPSSITVMAGDTVCWIWQGPGIHTSTCDGVFPGTLLPSGALGWDATLNSSCQKFEYIITKIGIYNYISKFNPSKISGTITAESTLPVELMDFVATTIKNEVILDWSTGGELNNDRFEIQRFNVTDVTDFDPLTLQFETIGVLYGNGTSNEIHHYRFKDRNLESGSYLYRLKQLDYNSNFIYHILSDEVMIGIPEKFNVSQNYPNPFNPTTKINYEVSEPGNLNISVFNSEGKEVLQLINEYVQSGYRTIEINGSDLSSGVYYYSVNFVSEQNSKTMTKKMVLLK